MEIIVNAPVFNRQLLGEAVHVTGFDTEGTEWNHKLLVRDVDGNRIKLVAFTSQTIMFHIEDFERVDGLKMKVWEEVKNG